MKRATRFLTPLALFASAVLLQIGGGGLGELAHVGAFFFAFVGAIALEKALKPEDAHLIQLGFVALIWLSIAEFFVRGSAPLSADYLVVLAGAAGTVAFFQQELDLSTKKLIYGLLTFLVVFPALMSVFSPSGIDAAFGDSAGDAFRFAALLSIAAYAVAWIGAWMPVRAGKRTLPPPVDSEP